MSTIMETTAANSEQSAVTCATVAKALIGHISCHSGPTVILPNVYVGRSPWESDAIKVTPSYFWTEYEIKLSVEDYRADFQKRFQRYRPATTLAELPPEDGGRWEPGERHKCNPRKHDCYAADSPIYHPHTRNRDIIVPKPKQFYFVVPIGMLSNVDVPAHCGIIEYDQNDSRGWGIKVARRAPNLKKPTKLSQGALFNLAMKATCRLRLSST